MKFVARLGDNKGFSVPELLIVIVVIGILTAIGVVSYGSIQANARDNSVRSDAESVEAEITRYSTKNAGILGSAVEWYSPDGENSNIQFTPSEGNIIDVVANTKEFCIRIYNESSATYKTLETALTRGDCDTLNASIAAGGDGNFDQPDDCPSGFIPVPGSSLFGTEGGFCVMKYEAKTITGEPGDIFSYYAGTPMVNVTQTQASSLSTSVCDGCHLMSEAEWLTIAHNVVSVVSNWDGGSIGTSYMYNGHTDNSPASILAASTDDNPYFGTGNSSGSQRRTLTLTNGEVIWDFSGNADEWTSSTITTGKPGGSGSSTRDWNNLSVPGNPITPNPFPSHGTPAAASWQRYPQRIGALMSDSNDATIKGFLRGGNYAGGGVFHLRIVNAPSSSLAFAGFRVAR